MTDDPFMTDDFANDKQIQRIRREREAFQKMMNECIGLVSSNLGLQPCADTDLKDFVLVQSLPKPGVTESFQSTNPLLQVDVSIVQYHTEVHLGNATNAGTENYFFALLTLRREFPHTLIYPETITEKIADLFTRSELDFKEQKKFSWKFYTITKDKEKLAQLLYNKPLDDLTKYKEMEVEINKNLCLMRLSRRPVSKTEAIEFCEFVKDINRVFN